MFQESMKWFKDDDWSWNGLRRPYKIQEQHPDLILIDPHLSVSTLNFSQIIQHWLIEIYT